MPSILSGMATGVMPDKKDAKIVEFSYNEFTYLMGGGYAFCSSLMLIFNKLAIGAFNFPSTLMALQFAFSAVAVWCLTKAGQVECEPLEWSKAPVQLGFAKWQG